MHKAVKKRLLLLWLVALIGTGCSQDSPTPPVEHPTPPKSLDATSPASTEHQAGGSPRSVMQLIGLTYLQADGNRFVEGRGNLPAAEPLDIALDGRPAWVVGAAASEGSIWVAVLDDGRAQGFHVVGSSVKPVVVVPPNLPQGMPPALIVDDDRPVLVTSGAGNASELTHAVPLGPDLGAVAYISKTGDFLIEQGDETLVFEAEALPDARLLVDEEGRVLFLSDATTRYGHSVLGDATEAGGISLVDASPSSGRIMQFEIEDGRVVEGISPIWTDWDRDGMREIIVTESEEELGARIVVYDEHGIRIAESTAIGRGFRWRHQLAVAPFGPEGEIELVAVLTPHIGGVVEFFQLVGNTLEIVAQVPGYSSHLLGSRNLDRAAAGDFDGDGSIELLAPDQAQEVLGAIRRTSTGAEVVWTLTLDGQLATNLAAVVTSNGQLALGAGREDGTLRLWLPDLSNSER